MYSSNFVHALSSALISKSVSTSKRWCFSKPFWVLPSAMSVKYRTVASLPINGWYNIIKESKVSSEIPLLKSTRYVLVGILSISDVLSKFS